MIFFQKNTKLDDVGLVPIGMPLGSLPAEAGAREGHRTPQKPLQGTHRTGLEDVTQSPFQGRHSGRKGQGFLRTKPTQSL